jgi:hypothetical protein
VRGGDGGAAGVVGRADGGGAGGVPMTPLLAADLKTAKATICANHYAHSVPAGKSYYFQHDSAIVVFSIPANQNVGRFLLKTPTPVWELSRLWAPDEHRRNLLTEAIAAGVRAFRRLEPAIGVLVSYADPNVGHQGYVYRAASWLAFGQCEESRYYVDAAGQVVSRRKFHSGRSFLKKAEIEALGFRECKKPGRLRYVLPLNRWTRRTLLQRQKEVLGA